MGNVIRSVSYTHLDVYKRQIENNPQKRKLIEELEILKAKKDCLLYTSILFQWIIRNKYYRDGVGDGQIPYVNEYNQKHFWQPRRNYIRSHQNRPHYYHYYIQLLLWLFSITIFLVLEQKNLSFADVTPQTTLIINTWKLPNIFSSVLFGNCWSVGLC